jgi:hypothetical protein
MKTVALPDFNDMIGYANQISDLLKRKLMLEAEISFGEAEVTKWAMSTFKVNDKPPSMEYIKNTFLVVGMEGLADLKEKRLELVEILPELERAKLMLQIYRDMLDVYRTESANERAASLA